MSGFGVELDENRNWAIKGEGAISNGRSAITVLIVPANEEMIVARETAAVVGRAIAANQTLAGKAS
jgi:acetate kinase